tara:strand:+ start:1643 stop:2074 length:432 start_codon:yes stop_codon:yes gene_type:complete
MATAQAYKWDRNEKSSSQFEIQTKYYDFGASSQNKTIYSITLQLGLAETGLTSTQIPNILVYYKTRPNPSSLYWNAYSAFWSGGSTVWNNSSTSLVVKKEVKIHKVPGLQLKIAATSMPKEVFISGIDIEYRILREKSVSVPQ